MEGAQGGWCRRPQFIGGEAGGSLGGHRWGRQIVGAQRGWCSGTVAGCVLPLGRDADGTVLAAGSLVELCIPSGRATWWAVPPTVLLLWGGRVALKSGLDGGGTAWAVPPTAQHRRRGELFMRASQVVGALGLRCSAPHSIGKRSKWFSSVFRMVGVQRARPVPLTEQHRREGSRLCSTAWMVLALDGRCCRQYCMSGDARRTPRARRVASPSWQSRRQYGMCRAAVDSIVSFKPIQQPRGATAQSLPVAYLHGEVRASWHAVAPQISRIYRIRTSRDDLSLT